MAIYQQGTLDNFKPEIWSARLKSNLNKKLVYGGLVNRDYEGEISNFGDTVHVNNIGRITIGDYTINGTAPTREALSDGQTSLTITQAKAFNFGLDDIDKAQSKGSIMEEAMKEAAYALADVADQYIAGLYTEATATTGLTAGLTTDKDQYYEMLVANRQKFRELNVPIDDLNVVIAPWMEALILQDARFVHASVEGDKVLRNGEIGKMAGFNIVVSNNVPIVTSTTYEVLSYAGKKGVTFADAISKTEAYRPEDSFIDAVKGLHVYGAKTIDANYVLYSPVVKA